MTKKKLDLKLLGVDAFALLEHFKRSAKKQGWSAQEIEEVIAEATSGDYNHLLATLMSRQSENAE